MELGELLSDKIQLLVHEPWNDGGVHGKEWPDARCELRKFGTRFSATDEAYLPGGWLPRNSAQEAHKKFLPLFLDDLGSVNEKERADSASPRSSEDFVERSADCIFELGQRSREMAEIEDHELTAD
jgi:hypothetical protein